MTRWASGIYRCWIWHCEGYGLREDDCGRPACRKHGGRGDKILDRDGITMWLDGAGVEITDAVARALDIYRASTPAEHAAEQARYVEAHPGFFDDLGAELAVIDGEWADEVETVLRRCA